MIVEYLLNGKVLKFSRLYSPPIVRRFIVLAAISSLALTSCEENLSPPQIWIDISPVYVGMRSIDPTVPPRKFDLQLTNRGDELLVIESFYVRGDTRCAFEFEGPDVNELKKNETAFIRGWYGPSEATVDQIALEIYSNCHIYPTLVVPVCGRGVPPGTEDAGPPPVCQVPPLEQPDCDTR